MSKDTWPKSRSSLAELLRGRGIGPTHQRLEIAHILFTRWEHLSADQILAAVNLRQTQSSKATVYNTLKLFLEKGLVREVIVDPARIFYDPNTTEHHHVYDLDRGELIDVDANQVRVVGLPPLPEGSVVDGVDVIVRIRKTIAHDGGQPSVTDSPEVAKRPVK